MNDRSPKAAVLVLLMSITSLLALWPLIRSATGDTVSADTKETHVYTTYSVPSAKSDTVHVVEAYERLMERYMDITEENFALVSTDMQAILSEMRETNKQLKDFDKRLARIEKHLGIEPEKDEGKTKEPSLEQMREMLDN